MDNELVSSAMEIILHAGDARTKCKEALEAVASFDLTVAHERMAEAHSEITRAHRVQTDAIQGRGARRGAALFAAVHPCSGHPHDHQQRNRPCQTNH